MRYAARGFCLPVLLSACAGAAVVRYDLRYTLVYQQLGAAAPTVPGVYVWSSRVDLTDSTDASLASVTTPNSIGAFLFPVGESSFLASRSFASEAAMYWTFPAGTYTVTLAGGGLGGVASALVRPTTTFYPEAIPAFTPAAVAAIASAPVTVAWPLTFNVFGVPPGANAGLFNDTATTENGTEIFSTVLGAESSVAVIPSNTMTPASNYRLRLAFSSQRTAPSAGFPGATAIVAFDRETIYAFTTRTACGADFTGDALVDDADFVVFADQYQILDCADAQMQAGCPADLSADGFVDDADFVAFATAYNAFLCP